MDKLSSPVPASNLKATATLAGPNQTRDEGHVTHPDPTAQRNSGSPTYHDQSMKLMIWVRASVWFRNRVWSSSSHSRVAKNDSAMPVNGQSPLDPIDNTIPARRQRRPNAMLPY